MPSRVSSASLIFCNVIYNAVFIFCSQAYTYWLNDMYMDVRIPLPINSNPGMVMPPRHFATVNDVARFAAQVIDGIMRHKEIIDG